ncbi:hypothetical protein A0H81_01237 [Grifola frondosa]|uniref:Uncharacterized protein n=1 Tax=Grifola frondosa TaxID=5627 RepID=A0A1C7MSZ2_GRIFR|nr:hypothetical protein A0H81_01237 [Grifola frondosa]
MWKTAFYKGILSYRAGNLESALAQFSEAIDCGANEHTVYDARAAVNQKLGRVKDALQDSKKVLDLEPNRWHGYARSARLFLQLHKYQSALRMADLALERMSEDQHGRRAELTALRHEISAAHEKQLEARRRFVSRTSYHFGTLPVEIATTIFSLTAADDHAFVIALSQVCRTWRDTRNPVKKIKVWNVRSKGRLFELCLRTDFTSDPRVLDHLRELPIIFLRILRVTGFPIAKLPHYLPALTDGILPNLHELELVDGTMARHESSWLWGEPDMQLRRLVLHGSEIASSSWSSFADNFKSLEFLSFMGTLSDVAWPHFLWLLHTNTNLHELELWLGDELSINPSIEQRELPSLIQMPHLAHLRLHGAGPILGLLVPMLTLPSLRTIQFSRCRPSVDLPLRHLSTGDLGILRTLTIQRCTFSAPVVIEILRASKGLETLELSDIWNSQVNDVLNALATAVPPLLPGPQSIDGPSRGLEVLCPALKALNCSGCSDVTAGPLVRLVKLRLSVIETVGASKETQPIQSVAPISSLIIDHCPAVDADILPWLRSKVPTLSCIYMSKKNAAWKRVL